MAVTLGVLILRVRAVNETAYTSSACQGVCNDSGIALEFAVTTAPQQVGVSEKDGHMIATIARCLLKDGNFLPNLWGEMFFAAFYISNRSPNAALHSATPYSKMHGKEADMTGLRTIGARAFVHVETHTTNMGDKAWEGKVCGFSPNRRSYNVYNAEKEIVVESQNVTFIEIPQGVRRMQEDERHRDERVGRACTNDATDYASLLGPLTLGSSREASRDEVEIFREETDSVVRENAAQSDSSEEGGISSAETSDPCPGVARRVNVMTRSGTRPNPTNEEGGTSTTDTSAPSPGVARRVNVVTRSGKPVNPSNKDTKGAALVSKGALND